jgi:molybdate transport system substrate-binding protein
MNSSLVKVLIMIFGLGACVGGAAASAPEGLLIYAGAASRPPTEEAARQYEKKTGLKIDLVIGGSGYMLSQMKLAKQGDIYFPGSSDYMEKAKREGIVYSNTEKVIVYLVPSINVVKGNPHGIRTLKDLTKPGLRVAIANPEGVCVGAYAVEIVENALSPAEKTAFQFNLVNYTESCEKTAAAISLKMADAVLGWSVFEYWDPGRIQTIKLPASQVPRIGYIPIAISRFTKQREAAQRFIDFMTGPEGRKIFDRYKYFTSAKEAMDWLGATKPVGGEYVVPAGWIKK